MTERKWGEALAVGSRVQSHPVTDYWMMGARYGEIIKLTKVFAEVKFDNIGRITRVHRVGLRLID